MKKIVMSLIVAFTMLFACLAFAAVDLNSATEAELSTVKGIGPVKAKAIVDYRQKNGVFKSVDDLNRVKGFGAQTIEKLRGQLIIGSSVPKTPPAPGAAPASVAPKPAPIAPAPVKR